MIDWGLNGLRVAIVLLTLLKISLIFKAKLVCFLREIW